MPFRKVGSKYVSPSGRVMTGKQVAGYYATHPDASHRKDDDSKRKPNKA